MFQNLFKKICILLLLLTVVGPVYAQDGGDDDDEKGFMSRFTRLCTDTACSEDIPTEPGLYEIGFTHDDLLRTFILSLPETYPDSEDPLPLVLVFHGSGQTARSFATKRGDLFQNTEEQGYILVFPNGTDLTGRSRWTVDKERKGAADVDDYAFVAALLDAFQETLTVDAARIYAAGFSNGGVFTHALGARMPDTFAAIAAVGSSIGGYDEATDTILFPPEPASPIPVMIVNGRQDTARPWEGGKNRNDAVVAPVRAAVDFWVEHNGCDPEPEIQARQDATTEVYTCQEETVVLFVALDKMTHHWPDASRQFGMDANRVFLEFFSRFPVESVE